MICITCTEFQKIQLKSLFSFIAVFSFVLSDQMIEYCIPQHVKK